MQSPSNNSRAHCSKPFLYRQNQWHFSQAVSEYRLPAPLSAQDLTDSINHINMSVIKDNAIRASGTAKIMMNHRLRRTAATIKPTHIAATTGQYIIEKTMI
ncbi:hypothetical protein B7R74_03025 [Yersinia pseudotuberculosis]|uniref:hypothetical protein n=1 Tax=Yersinia pseudotuberculosis TaxID=633 RepID=UPI000415E012|nr:hypothetical protein [Yersinia pseudotuberculosis]PSH23437.1 hypothetical protein B7R74_03025 [Yersinia pseudotuberculosis]